MKIRDKIEETVAKEMDTAAPKTNLFNVMQFSKFFSVGVMSTLVDWVIFTTLSFIGANYQSALAVSYAAGAVVNFTANRKLTFGKTDKTGKRFLYFIVIVIFSYLVSAALMWAMVDHYHLNSIVSRVISTFIVFVLNYFMHKNITFK